MIEFMILAAPRSGTTWVANWLTTNNTLCLHDPLWKHHYNALDKIESKKVLGVACTGLYMFPDFVNYHPARKIILHRDEQEINESLNAIGLPPVSNTERDLKKIAGYHLDWREVFMNPRGIYEYLTGFEFDEERHAFLKEIEMQPYFAGLKINKEVTLTLLNELEEITNNV